jgi:hypothetical protein
VIQVDGRCLYPPTESLGIKDIQNIIPTMNNKYNETSNPISESIVMEARTLFSAHRL